MPDGPQPGNDLTTFYVSGDAFRSGGRLLALRAGQYASLFVCSIIVARALGPPERAEYALVLSLAAIVWMMISAGLDSAASRILGRREGSLRTLRLLSAAALVLGAIGMAFTFGVGLLLQDSVLQGASVLSIALGAATVPCLLVTQYSSALLFRMGALSSYGRVVVIAGLLQLALLAATVSITDLTAQSALVIALVVSAEHCGWLGRRAGAGRR